MKFKLTKTHRYWWPVTVQMPDPENAGQYFDLQLKVQLEPLPRAELLEATEASAGLTTMREWADHEIAMALRVVKDWADVVDDQEQPVPFSDEMLTVALQQSWFRKGINDALRDSQNGEAARLGN